MIAWLEARIAVIRWMVIVFAITASFWSGKHWEWLEWQADIASQKSKQIEVVHDVKIIHDHVNSMPVGDSLKQLRKSWQR